MNSKRIITLILGLSFILLGCSTNKPTQSSENNSSSSEKKITVVSEQEFVAEASKIEKHYYESATVNYSRVITTREDSSLEDEVETYSGTYNFTISKSDKESPNPNISFVYDIHPGEEEFHMDPESFLLPSGLMYTNHLLNVNHIVTFYKNQGDSCLYTFYLNPFTVIIDIVYEDYHPVMTCKYDEYGYPTYVQAQKEMTIHNEDKTTQSIDVEEANINYK